MPQLSRIDRLRRFRADDVTLVPGYFRDSFPRFPDRRFSFVQLDLGIYQACKELPGVFLSSPELARDHAD